MTETAAERPARRQNSGQLMCQAPLVFRYAQCHRRASVLSTDVARGDPYAYTPVCKVHLRQAITRGLQRAASHPAGYRVPIMILPLDEAPPSRVPTTSSEINRWRA